ncbi:hypothetical protein EZV62_022089 [Acer yangbiense]|uniref:Pentatricopeptide repeat-containing protein n=1 Tax=Acer yangbiense TaxID=1000413 RepID=A0A5C7H7H5_9ROSI|nr:hypothetical protein EZV62_022089 [Acer yangbiense]
MLSGYIVNEKNKSALCLLSQIHNSGVCIDSYTFSSVVKVCLNLLNLRLGLQVHGLNVTCGYESDYIVGSILIDLYAKLGKVKNALELFHRLLNKDIVAWSGLIMGCAKTGLNSLAFSLFRDMINLDLEVDQFVVSSVLKVYLSLASLGSGKQVHALCVKSGFNTKEVTVTSLVDMYSKCGEIEDGLALFNNMPKRDVVSWTGVIVGCRQNGRAKEAITFFQEMIQSGADRWVVFGVELWVVSGACAWKTHGAAGWVVVGAALYGAWKDSWVFWVALCAVFGEVAGAIRCGASCAVFWVMGGAYGWTVLGAARWTGCVAAVCGSFGKKECMRELAVCDRSGGRAATLARESGTVICQGISCTVGEVETLIANMPFEPDKTIWCSMLKACEAHKNIKLVSFIAEHLLATSAEDPSIYMMLSNVYATLGMWDSSSKMRKAGKDLGIKEAGISWIEISS